MSYVDFWCIICGVRTCSQYDEHSPVPPQWLSNYRLIYPRRCHPLKTGILKPTQLYICSRGRIKYNSGVPQGVPNPHLEIRVWDNDPTISEQLSARVPIAKHVHDLYGNGQPDPSLPSCFSIHQACWDIFQRILGRLGIRDSDGILSTLYKAADVASSTSKGIKWPHGYGEECMKDYWMRARHGYEGIPKPLLYLEANLNDEALHARAQCPNQGCGCDQYIIRKADNGEMPAFLPFPPELVDKILSYLSMRDLISLQQVPSNQKVEIPQHIWRDLFHPRAEFGFLEAADIESDTWYQRALSAQKLLETAADWPVVRNRRRIWQLSLSVIDFTYDTNISQSFNMTELAEPMTPDEIFHPQGLVVRALSQEIPSEFGHETGTRTLFSSRLSNFKTSHVRVSYVGSGELRFISGLTFLPGGQRIGRINPHGQKYLAFGSGNGTTNLTLWVASSESGLLDLTVTEELFSTPDWTIRDGLQKAAVTRRCLTIKDGMLEIQSLFVGIEISRITELGIWSNDIRSIEALDRRESFIQRNLWAPGLISSVLNTTNIDILPFYGFQEMNPKDDYTTSLSPAADFLGPRSTVSIFQPSYIPEREKTEFHPMEGIFFGDETVVRFTCWTQTNRDLSSIEVVTRERPSSPYILGSHSHDKMVSVDILLEWENGEVISSLNIIKLSRYGKVLSQDSMNTLEGENAVWETDHGPVVGIEIDTSFGRKFSFSGWQEEFIADLTVDKLGLCEGRRIVGFYGRTILGRYWSSLESIGIMSDAELLPATPQSLVVSPQPVNPQLVPGYHGAWAQRGCVRFIDNGHFESFISFSNIASITPYYRNHVYSCYVSCTEPFITGFVFTYNVDGTVRGSGRSIWGQIADARVGETIFMNLEGGEVVDSVSLHTVVETPLLHRTYMLTGLKLLTSRGREIHCGDCNKGEVFGTFSITKKDLLLWEYDNRAQYFFLQTESGDKVSAGPEPQPHQF